METRIVVAGGGGRMGGRLIEAVRASAEARLVGVTVASGRRWEGPDPGAPVTDDPIEVVRDADAVIDFTTPAATVSMAELCAQARAVHVVGTTGLLEPDLAMLARAARHAAVVRSGNMSLGVNLLLALAETVGRALGPDYDVEVIESHHRHKRDAPSGTALMLGEAVARGRGVALVEVAERGRDGAGLRAEGAIGFHAVRGGDVVGEHDVLFAGPGERLVLSHHALDRGVFAAGALRAALWGQGRAPGEYDMRDVLGLR